MKCQQLVLPEKIKYTKGDQWLSFAPTDSNRKVEIYASYKELEDGKFFLDFSDSDKTGSMRKPFLTQ